MSVLAQILEYYALVRKGQDNLEQLPGTTELGVTLGFTAMQVAEHHGSTELMVEDIEVMMLELNP